jgi:hypothetical protein
LAGNVAMIPPVGDTQIVARVVPGMRTVLHDTVHALRWPTPGIESFPKLIERPVKA